MAQSKISVLQFRRKREGKTNYKKRLALLLAEKPRLVIRRSLRNIELQIIEYSPKGDKVTVSVNSRAIRKMGWNYSAANVPASYLTGILLGKKAAEKKVKEVIPDIGLYPSVKGSRIYAALKGVIDAGVAVSCSEEIIPKKERITGKHIADYARELKSKNPDIYKKQFSKYIKNNADPEQIEENFKKIKQKIIG